MATTTSQIQEIYVGLLGRAADAEGLAYWTAEIDGGVLTIEQLRANIVNEQAEYASGLGTLTRAQLVNTLYNNLFNRDADNDGLTYWVNGDGASVNADQLVLALSDGASAADRLILDNRTTAATYYTNNAATYDSSEAAAVIADVGSTTASLNAAKTAVDEGSIGAGVGSNFVLTTDVDAVSGGSLADTITGLMGTSGTYSVGDNINGGGGEDVVNLVAGSHTDGAGGLVSLDAVETVNVRLIGTAADTLTMNAADWSGVSTLSNASSLAGTTLQVSGLELSTDVTINGNTDVIIGYSNTTTATEAATVSIVSVGNDTTATTLGSASGAATANVDVDLANGGLITAVNLSVEGSSNIARIEAGSNVETLTITGSGNAILVTDDTLTAINATAALGDLDITVSGASDVAVVGGAGDDTLRLGTTLSNGDSFDGGDGDDTLIASIGGFNRNLTVSNVESVSAAFTEAAGGTLNFSGSTVTQVSLGAGTAGNDGLVAGLTDGAVVTLADDDLGDVVVDFESGALTATINVGSATGDVGLASLSASDVANVTVVSVGGGSAGATASITTATFDTDTTALTYQVSGGNAALAVGDGGDASIGAAQSLTYITNGSGNINFDSNIAGGTSLASYSVTTNGSTGASATMLGVSGSALTSVTLNASAADISVGAVALGNAATAGTTQDTQITVTQNKDAAVTISSLGISGAGTHTISVTQNATADFDLGTVDLNGEANQTGNDIALTFEPVSVSVGGTYAVNNIDAIGAKSGTQITFGTVTVGQDADWSAGSISATAVDNLDIADLTFNVGASGVADLGAITTTAGAVGDITLVLGANATASLGAIAASAVGALTVSLQTGASAEIGAISVTAGTMGAMEIAGVDGASFSAGAIGSATTIGAISVSGAADITLGTMSATTVGTIDATNLGISGSFTIDLSGVTNAAEVNLGAATNSVISGKGNDVITLTAGTTGNDTINFNSTGQGLDNVINFGAGSTGGDIIGIGGTGLDLFFKSGAAQSIVTPGTTVSFASATAALAGTAELATGDNILIMGSAFASTAGMLAAIASGGTQEIAFSGGSALTSGNMLVVWQDGNDSYVSTVSIATAATAISADASISTLAQLDGVTPGALVAANFDFAAL